jgi:hypothetical protein
MSNNEQKRIIDKLLDDAEIKKLIDSKVSYTFPLSDCLSFVPGNQSVLLVFEFLLIYFAEV